MMAREPDDLPKAQLSLHSTVQCDSTLLARIGTGSLWCHISNNVVLVPQQADAVRASAGSILDISKYRDTCERSISILDGIAILRYIE